MFQRDLHSWRKSLQKADDRMHQIVDETLDSGLG